MTAPFACAVAGCKVEDGAGALYGLYSYHVKVTLCRVGIRQYDGNIKHNKVRIFYDGKNYIVIVYKTLNNYYLYITYIIILWIRSILRVINRDKVSDIWV